jgi:hypothetical protein
LQPGADISQATDFAADKSDDQDGNKPPEKPADPNSIAL